MPRNHLARIVCLAICLAVLTGLSLLGASPAGSHRRPFDDWSPPVNLATS
jgi:hypothetical protein